MSFGFSIGDIIEVSRITTDLIRRVRTAGAEFREFEGDLELARSVFVSIEENWNTDSGRTTAARLIQEHNATLQATMTGIQNGLNGLRHQLDSHSRTRFSRFQLSYRLQDLRRRLDFHMGSLQLVMQNLSLMQGRSIEDAMHLIREGQEEQRREDQRNHISRQRNPNEHEWNESLSSFEMRYVPLRSTGRASAAEESSTSASRDYVIERWRQTVASTLPTHPSPPNSFLGEATNTHSPRVHSVGSQSTSSPDPLPGEATPSHSTQVPSERLQSSESTAVATGFADEAAQHQQYGSENNLHQLVPSAQDTPNPEQPSFPFGGKFGRYAMWIYIATLLLWFITMALAIAEETTAAGAYGSTQGLGALPSQPP
jgi:hypothetical protein